MSTIAETLAREANAIHFKLKELMRSREPFDREVESQCKRLRNELRGLYENLLILHPHAPDSKDVENHLWMQTSYNFISSYKERISAMDRILDNRRDERHHGRRERDDQQRSEKRDNVVEYRKLLQKFRQFLAEETKYWNLLVLRVCRMFALDDVRPALMAVGILNNTSASFSDAVTEFPLHPPLALLHGESAAEPTPLATQVEKQDFIFIVTKILVYLGDLARYRELYNDSEGRPRAGHHDKIPAKPPRRRNGHHVDLAQTSRWRDYSKAKQCYEQAKILFPAYGHSLHQLAIIATWERNSFLSCYYHYRAICVSQPAERAGDNLNSCLVKALDVWISRGRGRENQPVEQLPEVKRNDAFREKLVVLHALWKVGSETGLEEMESISSRHHQATYEDFLFLLSNRALPIESVTSAVIMSQSALYKFRMFRDSTSSQNAAISPDNIILIENEMFLHILEFHRALLEVGRQELREPIVDEGADLAQRISATLRRTLPSLRVAGKWLRANFKFVAKDPEFLAKQLLEERQGNRIQKAHPERLSVYSPSTNRFWEIYADFIRALGQNYAQGGLPRLATRLDEDEDLKGFSPLRNLLGDGVESLAIAEGQHPNEDQLMRIWDILEDANAIATFTNSPIKRLGNVIVTSGIEEDPIFSSEQQNVSDRHRDEDAMTESTSKTDDDPISDAFKHLNAAEQLDDDDDDEQIVWDPTPSGIHPPPLPPSQRAQPITPSKPPVVIDTSSAALRASPAVAPQDQQSPLAVSPPRTSPVSGTTAQDLLNSVLGRSSGSNNRVLGPSLYFASAEPIATNRPGASIWSASDDERNFGYAVNNQNGMATSPYSPTNRRPSASFTQDINSAPSIWPNSYANGAQQGFQNGFSLAPGSPLSAGPGQSHPSSLGVHPQLGTGIGLGTPSQVRNHQPSQHQRTSSSSIPSSHFFSSPVPHRDPYHSHQPAANSATASMPLGSSVLGGSVVSPSTQNRSNQPLHQFSQTHGLPSQLPFGASGVSGAGVTNPGGRDTLLYASQPSVLSHQQSSMQHAHGRHASFHDSFRSLGYPQSSQASTAGGIWSTHGHG